MEKVRVAASTADVDIEERVRTLLAEMTLDEKIGQMCQINGGDSYIHDYLMDGLRAGRVGSVLNEVNVETVNEMQRIAIEESRLGIPLLIGRDVIHGFRTIMPIPLGQAASWNPDLAAECSRAAALEAASTGVNWTFAPMIDIARDPRWGRIAESLGEDPHLASVLGAAMVRGYQGDDLSDTGSIAACAKHFAGYGASESGRDYATTNIPENELRNVYLPPFKAAVDEGVATLMTSFGDLDGVPATANEFLLRDVLREDWGFDGFVVSDWDSVRQLSIHGLTSNDRESALEAARAGVDMEMHGDAYLKHIADLIGEGLLEQDLIDNAVASILRIKFRLGLFDNAYTNPADFAPTGSEAAMQTARRAAVQSAVLLKNDHHLLPLAKDEINRVAVIGPLADEAFDQLGTWIFDGDPGLSQTPLDAIRGLLSEGDSEVVFHRALDTSRSRDTRDFDEVVKLTEESDVAVLFLGEESILSGEAHSRADINLPGAQAELVQRIRETGRPIVAVILAGRPLTLTNIVDHVDAILYAWHPGTMGGPAIADLLFGIESPSGKLPVSFPRMVGQVPIYYNHKNTGKPPTPEQVVHIDDIDARAPQLSLGMVAFHLDAGYTPLFPFGHGLSYAAFDYQNIRCDQHEIELGEALRISAEVTNTGDMAADEVVQLYVRDLVGNVTRPVRELKAFERIRLEPGQQVTVDFEVTTDDLSFYGRRMQWLAEPGEFHAWIGGSSEATLETHFRIVACRS